MSLSVPDQLIEKAKDHPVSNEEFIACVKTSLPYAWNIFESAVEKMHSQEEGPGVVEPDDITEAQRGELLRALSSDAIRGAVEGHFNVRLAFQNCHKTAAFPLNEVGSELYNKFVSIRSQILNQRPGLVDC